MRPTDEQRAALDLFLRGDDMLIDAGAGCGKTSVLRLLAAATPRRGRYLVFSKELAREVEGTMPDRCHTSTAHSMAYKQFGYRFRHRLNGDRVKSSVIASVLGLHPYTVSTPLGAKTLAPGWQAGHVMRALERFYQSTLPEPSYLDFPYVDGLDLPRTGAPNNVELARHLEGALGKAWVDIQQPNGFLRFTHGAYLKMFYLTQPKIHADYILFDEVQDANPVLAALVDEQTNSQRVYVGDENQAIFRFTGAVNAMEGFDVAHRRALTQTFRFGPEIAYEANDVLDMLDSPLRIVGSPHVDSTVQRSRDESIPDVLLTRTNATAVKAALRAQSEGIPVHLVGGGKDVAEFARAAKELKDRGRTSYWELQCFDSWDEVVRYVDEDPQGSDLALMVRLIEDFTVEKVLDAVEGSVPQRPGVMAVSTVHKAKGREWDHVRIADDMGEVTPTDDELRLRYVAFTRARRHLDLSGFEDGLARAEERARRSPSARTTGMV